ncbi:pyruvate:ferredoxin (flavodoxin) oxidoreductase [Clostridia bacterium]|nr:pyruvate:ferredoxin (flavodoxin) oxidoreductase [Clostridia bacterium]
MCKLEGKLVHDSYNVLLCGIGGQGTVLASRLIAQCAMDGGAFARTAETIGMAQRGGSVVSHVRWAMDKRLIPSPMITPGDADVLIAFDPTEAARCAHYLKDGGASVVCGTQIDGAALALECGSIKSLNMVMLGAASALLGFTLEDMTAALEGRVNPKFIEMNRRALKAGRDALL